MSSICPKASALIEDSSIHRQNCSFVFLSNGSVSRSLDFVKAGKGQFDASVGRGRGF